jgi:hypothetical protein
MFGGGGAASASVRPSADRGAVAGGSIGITNRPEAKSLEIADKLCLKTWH